MKNIGSADNPEIKRLVSLHQPKGRQEHRCFIAEGWRTITTLLAGNMTIAGIYVTEDLVPQAQETFKKRELTIVSLALMRKISQATTPSGVLAVFYMRPNPAADAMGAGLVLANISDPGNMGTLIRTAVAMNIDTVVIVEGTDPWSHKVVQATAGTIAQVKLYQTSWYQLLRTKGARKLYALIPAGGKNIEKTKCNDGLLVIGNEAHGLPDEWADQCEERVTIPMSGKAESLNAAIAGSIAAYVAFGRKA
ncbi:hypothetical protein CVU75_03335 [Candidatus Dependentiae bacterium HGW-Dependentiae-1]|nr:MAG: hypothetical protein CVU75_03335 [Candidatus Dependentiae bacterium HGW-Dependentiae-1]